MHVLLQCPASFGARPYDKWQSTHCLKEREGENALFLAHTTKCLQTIPSCFVVLKRSCTSMIDRCFGTRGTSRRNLQSGEGRHIRTSHTRIGRGCYIADRWPIDRLLWRWGNCSSHLSSHPCTHIRWTHTHLALRRTDKRWMRTC